MGSFDFVTTASSTTDASSYTFSSVSLGTADSDRRILVATGARASSARTITGVTIAGISATELRDSSADQTNASFWIAAVPSGTTGDIVLTYSGTMVRAHIAVFRLVGVNPTPVDVDSHGIAGSSSAARTVTLDSVAGGYAVGAYVASGASTSATWSGVTEDYDFSYEASGNRASGGHGSTAGTTVTVTVTPSGSVLDGILIAATFQDSATDATFSTTVGDATAAGGSTAFTADASFTTAGGEATADGGVTVFSGAAVFAASTGDATADGGSTSFTGGALFATAAADATAAGGAGAFTAAAVFTSQVGTATADGGSTSFSAGATGTFTTLTGDATAAGGSTAFTADALFATVEGAAVGDGGTGTFTAAASFVTLVGDATAAGGAASFVDESTPARVIPRDRTLVASGPAFTLTGSAPARTLAGAGRRYTLEGSD